MSQDSKSLVFLYKNPIGRVFLKILCAPFISKIAGAFLSSALSRPLIDSFARKNNINMNDYEDRKYHDFNDFFTRKIKPELRPIDMTPENFVAPCDGLLSAYKITGDTVLPVKQSMYKIKELLDSEEDAKTFDNGICLVFRLCVDHYHRYFFFDDCKAGEPRFIKGKLHTVRPIALETENVFKTNSREVTMMETANFGKVAQVEVGAMLVGKIKNHPIKEAKRGDEKGMFLYGGSTVILLFEKDRLNLSEDLFRNTLEYAETPVKLGEILGEIRR
ncbi:MAG: phosphatidylserine decarboxylase [Clostridiales bacterium]|nr:phosphatidylserine decarboxylase [Clostridiales bacterium]